MQISVRKISPEATRPLRQQLLRQGVPLDALIYPGDLEPDTLHIGAFADGEQVGVATVLLQPPNLSRGVPPTHPSPDDPRGWRLRGMATTEAVRGGGIGTKLLKVCVGYVASQAGLFLWCDARIAAQHFYAKNGFEPLGEVYVVPDVGSHYFMQRAVSPADIALLDIHLER